MNYANPTQLQAAILDWAGTVVDFGSFAPTQIFVEAFAEFDVQVSIEEARGPMGMGKWDHIRTLCDQPQVRRFAKCSAASSVPLKLPRTNPPPPPTSTACCTPTGASPTSH